MNKRFAFILILTFSIALIGCGNIRSKVGKFSGSHIAYKDDIPEVKKFLERKYEVIVDYLYLEKYPGHPYYHVININQYVLPSEKRRKGWIHIPQGAIFNTLYTARSNAFMSTGTYLLAKFETPGIFQKEFDVYYTIYIYSKGERALNTEYFREIK